MFDRLKYKLIVNRGHGAPQHLFGFHVYDQGIVNSSVSGFLLILHFVAEFVQTRPCLLGPITQIQSHGAHCGAFFMGQEMRDRPAVEVTEAMIQAGDAAFDAWHGSAASYFIVEQVYRAMAPLDPASIEAPVARDEG